MLEIAVYLTVPYNITIDVIPRPHRDRGNLLPGSEAPHHPIRTFRIFDVNWCNLRHAAVVEIATGINALAMTAGAGR